MLLMPLPTCLCRSALLVEAGRPGAPGAEVVAAAAAALAATSTAIKALPDWYQSSLAIRVFEADVASKAGDLYSAARAMAPQPNRPLRELGAWAQQLPAAQLVGAQVFGSSSVMDDLALAAGWLALATGALVRAALSACWRKTPGWRGAPVVGMVVAVVVCVSVCNRGGSVCVRVCCAACGLVQAMRACWQRAMRTSTSTGRRRQHGATPAITGPRMTTARGRPPSCW